jgi:phospho-N-acetylmuramoyl-pentapeptide-transferase
MTPSTVALSLAGLSFILTVIWGPPLIRILRYFKVGKQIRVDGPERHFSKLGTPTMGGIMIVLPVVFITLLLNAASLIGIKFYGRSILVPVGVMIVYAILGAIDDWEGLRGKRRGQGMRARTKFAIQVVCALITAFALWYYLDIPQIVFPGLTHEIEIGVWFVPFAAFIIVACSNAINLTDGLDGLAGLISATAFAAYGVIALIQGQIYITRFCFALVGSLFGFLWFNVHPALLFMGDTGALSLGATLATIALMTGQWALLPLIIIMPISITLSVVLQVAYFKLTGGRRLFKMAPLQHHFELSGWSETQVVQRFWLISLLGALIGVALVFA